MVFKKGQAAWNKGLTKETDKRVKSYCDKLTSERRSIILKKVHKNIPKERKKLINTKISNSEKGKIVSEETKLKISNANKGKILSVEHKNKISKSHTGIKNYFYGKHHTKKTRKIISEANKGKRMSKKTIEKIRITVLKNIKRFGGPRLGKNEKQIIDNLEKEMEYKIIRQCEACGYFLDGYIPELNLVIEIDEKEKFDLNNILKQKHIDRQQNIEKELNCKFLRIKDI